MNKRIFQKIKNFYHLFQAFIANVWYGFPSRKLKVIGVTGTDGKTTTTHLIYHILKSMGKKVSMVSSVYAIVGNNEYDTGFHVTTPDVFPLQKLLWESVKNNDEYFVLETTSHALYQYRVYGVNYEVGVLTNVTHEHLDMHHSIKEYTEIKSRLLKQARLAIVNADDKSYLSIRKLIPSDKITTYSLKKNPEFTDFDIAEFNKYNYLAAYTVAKALGLANDKIIRSLQTFKLPKGRFEIVTTKPYTVIIDFAHTPNGINEILKDVRKRYIKNRTSKLIHVFGSASERDSSKRPFMGEASGKYADKVILTEEDCRIEDPLKICGEIAVGLEKTGFKKTAEIHRSDMGNKKCYWIIVDRRKAIEKAISLASINDVVLITGKGHEKSICRGKTEVPWSDNEAVKDVLNV